MEFNVIRKRCPFRRTHAIRKTSSGVQFEDLCTLKGLCSQKNCILMTDAGGKEDDQSTGTKKAR